MQRFLIGLTVIVVVLFIGVNLYLLMSRPKLGYVRSQELIEKYTGTIEARTKFEQQKNAMLANVDSLKFQFEQQRQEYINNASKMTAAQRNLREKELTQTQNQYYQYSVAIDSKIKEADNEMMGAVLNQINSFVDKYAKQNNYDIIFGTTLDGSVLYGNESLDVTATLLEELNVNYKGR